VKRREFITLLGGAAAWPLAVRAQQLARNRKIGFLHPGQAENVNMRLAAIHEGLLSSSEREVNVELLVRLADGDLMRLPALARDLVDSRADAIIAAGPPAVHAASGATTEIPIVAIDLETDPVASGLIKSLARPGRNVTGVFLDLVADLSLRRGVPSISLFPDTAKMGGLLAYGPDIQSLYRQVAAMARRVLLGRTCS
jgi:putative ABC transport system substrate-binding protein